MEKEKPENKVLGANTTNGGVQESPSSSDITPAGAPVQAQSANAALPGKKGKKAPSFEQTLDMGLVKRKRRRRIASWITLVSAVGVSIFVIVAFIGSTNGTYSVKMEDKKGTLTMALEPTFQNKVTYLSAKGLENAYATRADNLPDDDVIDDEPGGSKNGKRISQTNDSFSYDTYLGYTFFIKNVSNSDVTYTLDLNIDKFKNPDNNATSPLDILRIRFYENSYVDGGAKTHSSETFARSTNTPFYYPDGTLETRECISSYDETNGVRDPSSAVKDENKGFATEFLSDGVIFQKEHDALGPGEMVRYTVIVWFEGFDPDCKGAEPDNATVTLSLNLTAL